MNGSKYNIRLWSLEKFGSNYIVDWLSEYDCNVYNFENQEIKISNDGYDILLLRDIWNWMADYIYYDENTKFTLDNYNPSYKNDPYANLIDGKKYLDIKYLYSLYYQYAKEFIESNEFIIISFNKWLVDEEYRKEILDKIGIEHKSYSIESDDILIRWEIFIQSVSFWEQLLNCQDAVELSKKIFGRPKRIIC